MKRHHTIVMCCGTWCEYMHQRAQSKLVLQPKELDYGTCQYKTGGCPNPRCIHVCKFMTLNGGKIERAMNISIRVGEVDKPTKGKKSVMLSISLRSMCVCVSGLQLRLGYCKCMEYQSLVPSRSHPSIPKNSVVLFL